MSDTAGERTITPIEVLCLFVITAVSGFASFKGLGLAAEMAGGGWTALAMAFVIATGISIALFTIWRRIFKSVPRLPRGPAQWLAGGVTIVFVALVLSVSSVSTVMGVAGKAALQHGLAATIAKSEEVKDRLYGRTRMIEGVLPDLKREEARYLAWEQEERSSGNRTCAGGKGTVSVTLGVVAGQFAALGEEVGTALGRAEFLSQQAGGQIDRLREIAGSDMALAPKSRHFAADANRLRATFVEMEGLRTAAALKRGLVSVRKETEGRNLTAGTRACRERQAKALLDIADDLEKTAARLSAALDEIEALPPAALPNGEALTAVSAVFRYAWDISVFWAMAISLDLSPLLLLAYVMVPRVTLSEKELSDRRRLALRVADILDFYEVENLKRHYGPKRERLERAERLHFSDPEKQHKLAPKENGHDQPE